MSLHDKLKQFLIDNVNEIKNQDDAQLYAYLSHFSSIPIDSRDRFFVNGLFPIEQLVDVNGTKCRMWLGLAHPRLIPVQMIVQSIRPSDQDVESFKEMIKGTPLMPETQHPTAELKDKDNDELSNMIVRIHYNLQDGTPDYIDIEGYTIEEIQEKVKYELDKRNAIQPWSEILKE